MIKLYDVYYASQVTTIFQDTIIVITQFAKIVYISEPKSILYGQSIPKTII